MLSFERLQEFESAVVFTVGDLRRIEHVILVRMVMQKLVQRIAASLRRCIHIIHQYY